MTLSVFSLDYIKKLKGFFDYLFIETANSHKAQIFQTKICPQRQPTNIRIAEILPYFSSLITVVPTFFEFSLPRLHTQPGKGPVTENKEELLQRTQLSPTVAE